MLYFFNTISKKLFICNSTEFQNLIYLKYCFKSNKLIEILLFLSTEFLNFCV